MQSVRFLGRLLGTLLKTGVPLMKYVLKLLAKSILIPLGLITAASEANSGIRKRILGPGMATLIISNGEMDDIVKMVKSLVESGLLIKGISETIKNIAKKQKGGFLNILLGTLGFGLSGNLLIGKRVKAKIPGQTVALAGEGMIKAVQQI